MAKDFQISSEQRDYLRMALTGSLYNERSFDGYRTVLAMERRGWLRRSPHYRRLYELTDLGRTVARQLGITAEGGAT